MGIEELPTINAILNAITLFLLTIGYVMIKKGNRRWHKVYMISALITSTVFFISYLIYHFHAGETKYPYFDWTRTLYFCILIPHIIFATIVLPLVIILVRFAIIEQYHKHKILARWVWPIWVFVSISGILVYLMLYQL